MSRPSVEIKVDYAGGHTIAELSKTLQARMKYLNESAFQSIHATAVNALTSIRAGTRVAKATGLKVNLVERADLHFSYQTQGSSLRISVGTGKASGMKPNRKMCLRHGADAKIAAVYSPGGDERIRFVSCHGVPLRTVKVYEFVDDCAESKLKYLIAAPSAAIAKKAAREIVARRLLRYAGLAKRAVSALMVKTNTKGPSDLVSARVYAKANECTEKRDVIARDSTGGGKYALLLYDNVRYAARALKGGSAAVDVAIKKAANKTVSVIQQKCKNLLLPGELSTPFPEVTKRGAA